MKLKKLISTVLTVTFLLGTAIPTGFAFAEDDLLGPIASAVTVSPNPAPINTGVTITAVVDDSTTGAANILSAEFSIDGGAWMAMSASDGILDTVTESVTATYTVTTGGDHEVCVRGTDALNNIGEPVCTELTGDYLYAFSGFFYPIKMDKENRVNAPQTIPVKWKLTSAADGTAISDRSSFVALMSYAVDCTTLAGEPAAAVIERSVGKSGLRYLGNGKWMVNWKTPKTYRHSCRMMYASFSDGLTSPMILFRFR